MFLRLDARISCNRRGKRLLVNVTRHFHEIWFTIFGNREAATKIFTEKSKERRTEISVYSTCLDLTFIDSDKSMLDVLINSIRHEPFIIFFITRHNDIWYLRILNVLYRWLVLEEITIHRYSNYVTDNKY